jgi:hypothetical protein
MAALRATDRISTLEAQATAAQRQATSQVPIGSSWRHSMPLSPPPPAPTTTADAHTDAHIDTSAPFPIMSTRHTSAGLWLGLFGMAEGALLASHCPAGRGAAAIAPATQGVDGRAPQCGR